LVWRASQGTRLDTTGTLLYHSGTWPQKQVYMGLAGLVTRDAAAGEVYPGVPYDNEVTLFYSDIDPAFNAQVVATANTRNMTAVHRHPTWFLVNGEPYSDPDGAPNTGDETPDIPAGAAGANTLLRLASTATDTHVAVLQGLRMTIHAEDGQRYGWSDTAAGISGFSPRVQYSAMLPPEKTKDAIIVAPAPTPPATQSRFAVYDGNGDISNPSDPTAETVGDSAGGMLRFLSFAAGNTPPTVNAVADQSNAEGDAVSLQVVASDADVGDTLSYALSGAPAGLGIDAGSGLISGTIAAGAAASSPYTATVDVSDGTHTTSVSFTWTVTALPPATQLTVTANGVPQAFGVLSYGGGGQDVNATTELLDGGNGLRIVGNGWKQVQFSCNVGAGTVLSFDFSSSAQGEIHGIGFDTNNSISSNWTFQLYGTQSYGRQNFHNYAGGVTSYSIPVGSFYTGSFSRLFFVMDHDVGNPTGESLFSNLTVTGCE
jgi:hypothetical protein